MKSDNNDNKSKIKNPAQNVPMKFYKNKTTL